MIKTVHFKLCEFYRKINFKITDMSKSTILVLSVLDYYFFYSGSCWLNGTQKNLIRTFSDKLLWIFFCRSRWWFKRTPANNIAFTTPVIPQTMCTEYDLIPTLVLRTARELVTAVLHSDPMRRLWFIGALFLLWEREAAAWIREREWKIWDGFTEAECMWHLASFTREWSVTDGSTCFTVLTEMVGGLSAWSSK